MDAEKTNSETSPEEGPRFIPRNPRVPGFVRVCGTAIATVGVAVAGLFAPIAGVIVWERFPPDWLVHAGLMAAIAGLGIVLFRLGRGLRRGERRSVYGMRILSGVALVSGVRWLCAHAL